MNVMNASVSDGNYIFYKISITDEYNTVITNRLEINYILG